MRLPTAAVRRPIDLEPGYLPLDGLTRPGVRKGCFLRAEYVGVLAIYAERDRSNISMYPQLGIYIVAAVHCGDLVCAL